MRAILLASCLSFGVMAGVGVSPAMAQTVEVREGRFDARVSADDLSRIVILGDRVVSVRTVSDPGGPQIMIEAEESTGDVYVSFEGAAQGRTFTVFFVTESGRTVQGSLRPEGVPGQTIQVSLGAAAGAASAPRVVSASTASSGLQDRTDKRADYAGTVTAMMRVLFRGEAVAGVSCEPGREGPSRLDGISLRVIRVCVAAGMRGQELSVLNTSRRAMPVIEDSYLVPGVMAVGSDRSEILAGQAARIFVVEEFR